MLIHNNLQLIYFFSGALLFGAIQAQDIDVQIEELWGDVNFKAGTQQDINCTVLNPGEDDTITWFIGGEPVRNENRPVSNVEEGEMHETLSLSVGYELDNAKVKCSCRDKEDEIVVHVYDVDIPDKVFLSINEGDDTVLKTGLKLFPAPEPGDVSWSIDGTEKIRMLPGEAGIKYKALEADVSGDPPVNYVYALEMKSVAVPDINNNYSLEIYHRGQNYSVDFKLSLTLNDSGQSIVTKRSSVTEQPQSSALGLGVWIVLIVVTIIVILVVIYFIYKRKMSKSRANGGSAAATQQTTTKSPADKTQYSKVKTKEEPV